MDNSALLPYLFQELVEQLGGVVDLDASKVLESIKSEERKGLAVSIANGILRVELLEQDELDENED